MIFSEGIQNAVQQASFFSFKKCFVTPEQHHILFNNTHTPHSLLPSAPVSLDLPPLGISLKGIIK